MKQTDGTEMIQGPTHSIQLVVHAVFLVLHGIVCMCMCWGLGGKCRKKLCVTESCVAFHSRRGSWDLSLCMSGERAWAGRQRASSLEEGATSTATLLLLLGVLGGKGVDLTDEIVEDLLDVVLGLGRGLNETAIEALGQVLSLLGGDDSLISQVALVSDQHHGDLIGILHTQNLISQLGEVVEGRLGDDGVDEDEALAVLHVEITHSSELLLETPKPIC